MKAVVVYESLWGNTAAVARAIAEGIGPQAQALCTDEASADVVAPAEPGPVPNAGPEPTAPPELPVIIVGIAVVAVGAAVLVAIVRRRALRAGR